MLKKSEYDVVEQLKKIPAHINILSLLMSSEPHRNALLSTLKEAQVPDTITPNNLQDMIGTIMEPNVITYSDEEIPEEGMGHTKALHIAVKVRATLVARVLVDNGSTLNICPHSTLKRLGRNKSQLRYSAMIVRAFDGTRKETLGEIELPVKIGSITFAISFQVLEVTSAYNLLMD